MTNVIDAVESLSSAAPDWHSAEATHQSITSGPLWSPVLRQRLATIRKSRLSRDLLIKRAARLSDAQPRSVVLLSVISHFALTIASEDRPSSEEILTVTQRVVDQLATTSSASATGRVDSMYAVGLSAVIRVGCMVGPSTRERLGQAYDLLKLTTTCRHSELQREIVSCDCTGYGLSWSDTTRYVGFFLV